MLFSALSPMLRGKACLTGALHPNTSFIVSQYLSLHLCVTQATVFLIEQHTMHQWGKKGRVKQQTARVSGLNVISDKQL
jgi:hypothetical protein